MIKSGRLLALVAIAALAIAGSATSRTLGAQSGTTGAIAGTVTDTAGQPLEAVQIQVVNRATGATTGTQSLSGGRYNVPNLDPGGPYNITLRRIGFASQTRDNIQVPLGQAVRADFRLVAQAAQLAAVAITATIDNDVMSTTHTGVSTTISDSTLRRSVTLNRNFTDFVKLTPQISDAGPGLSGGGVNNRFNKIQIDGTTSTDLFGLGSTGAPGGQSNGKSIPLEAVKEYQVILSSYDIRYSDFAGALVNAVTRNGTNDLKMSGFYQQRDQSYARNIPFIRNSIYTQKQYGFSIGGPIIKDRLHFFITPEWQDRNEPANGPYIGNTSQPSPVTQAQIDQFNQYLAKYSLGNSGNGLQYQKPTPLKNMFGRLDFQLPSLNSRAVFRYNYGTANTDVFSRSTASSSPLFGLSTVAYTQANVTHAPVFQFYTNLRNGADNEFIAGYTRVRDQRIAPVIGPNISVAVPSQIGTGFAVLQSGTEQFTQGNVLDQDLYEITDNFTFPIGDHRFTIGTHNEFFKIRNVFTESSYGIWEFASLDSLNNGIPVAYRHSASLGGDIIAKFRASSYSAYAQDVWAAGSRLALTFGLRVDAPGLDDSPSHTPAIDTLFGRNTASVPRRIYQWSPRFGFNWDITGDQTNQLRGGIGSFTGRPPFVWLGNSYQNNGSGLGFVNCGRNFTSAPSISGPTGQRPPDFNTTNIGAPPNYCINTTTGAQVGFSQGVLGPVDFINSNLKFPQVVKTTLGFDHQFADGTTLSLDALFTNSLHDLFYVNRNLVGPQGLDKNGRTLYGLNFGAPALVSSRVSEAIEITNQSKNYSYNLTGQLQHRFTTSFEGSVAYSFSKARDVQSLTSSRAVSNFQFGRTISGPHESTNVGISLFDQPHRLIASGTYTFPWKRFATNLSGIYIGESGPVYDYVYGSDMNDDGFTGNDLVYIPRNTGDPNEIQFSGTSASQLQQQNALEAFISGDQCLSSQRGKLMRRNSCRSPWQNRLDLTLRQSLPSVRGNALALEIGLFNALNYIGTRFGQEWGLLRFAGGNSNVTLLSRSGTSPAALTSQQIFTFSPTFQRFNNNNLASYYQFQAQIRYSFY